MFHNTSCNGVINREPSFFVDEDYDRYLNNLKEAALKNKIAIHAFVLKKNHVHLLATPATPFGLSHMMQGMGIYAISIIPTNGPARHGKGIAKQVSLKAKHIEKTVI